MREYEFTHGGYRGFFFSLIFIETWHLIGYTYKKNQIKNRTTMKKLLLIVVALALLFVCKTANAAPVQSYLEGDTTYLSVLIGILLAALIIFRPRFRRKPHRDETWEKIEAERNERRAEYLRLHPPDPFYEAYIPEKGEWTIKLGRNIRSLFVFFEKNRHFSWFCQSEMAIESPYFGIPSHSWV